jgi:hypothetical protein
MAFSNMDGIIATQCSGVQATSIALHQHCVNTPPVCYRLGDVRGGGRKTP